MAPHLGASKSSSKKNPLFSSHEMMSPLNDRKMTCSVPAGQRNCEIAFQVVLARSVPTPGLLCWDLSAVETSERSCNTTCKILIAPPQTCRTPLNDLRAPTRSSRPSTRAYSGITSPPFARAPGGIVSSSCLAPSRLPRY
jgi:hypothetical protein